MPARSIPLRGSAARAPLGPGSTPFGRARSTALRAGAASATLCALALAGCGRDAPGELLAYDLAHSLPVAAAVAPTLRLDLGAEDARARLGAGWSWNETAGDGTTFVWGVGGESRVRVSLNGLRPSELRLRALPFARDGASGPPLVEVRVDGAPAGELALGSGPGFGEYQLAVDPELWATADSVLGLRYRPAPGPAGAADRRALAVAWDWIGLASATRPAELAEPPRADRRRLRLPVGWRLDYRLDLEPGSRLEIDGAHPGPGSLLVVLAPDDGAARTLTLGADLAVDLGIERLAPATLSLLADPAATSASTLVLEAPRVVVPAG